MTEVTNAQNLPCWRRPAVEGTLGTMAAAAAAVAFLVLRDISVLSIASSSGIAVIVGVGAMALGGVALFFHAVYRAAQLRKQQKMLSVNVDSHPGSTASKTSNAAQQTGVPRSTDKTGQRTTTSDHKSGGGAPTPNSGQSPSTQSVGSGERGTTTGTAAPVVVTPQQQEEAGTWTSGAEQQRRVHKQVVLNEDGTTTSLSSDQSPSANGGEQGIAAVSRFDGMGNPQGLNWPVSLPKPPEQSIVSSSAASSFPPCAFFSSLGFTGGAAVLPTITEQQAVGNQAGNNGASTSNSSQSLSSTKPAVEVPVNSDVPGTSDSSIGVLPVVQQQGNSEEERKTAIQAAKTSIEQFLVDAAIKSSWDNETVSQLIMDYVAFLRNEYQGKMDERPVIICAKQKDMTKPNHFSFESVEAIFKQSIGKITRNRAEMREALHLLQEVRANASTTASHLQSTKRKTQNELTSGETAAQMQSHDTVALSTTNAEKKNRKKGLEKVEAWLSKTPSDKLEIIKQNRSVCACIKFVQEKFPKLQLLEDEVASIFIKLGWCKPATSTPTTIEAVPTMPEWVVLNKPLAADTDGKQQDLVLPQVDSQQEDGGVSGQSGVAADEKKIELADGKQLTKSGFKNNPRIDLLLPLPLFFGPLTEEQSRSTDSQTSPGAREFSHQTISLFTTGFELFFNKERAALLNRDRAQIEEIDSGDDVTTTGQPEDGQPGDDGVTAHPTPPVDSKQVVQRAQKPEVTEVQMRDYLATDEPRKIANWKAQNPGKEPKWHQRKSWFMRFFGRDHDTRGSLAKFKKLISPEAEKEKLISQSNGSQGSGALQSTPTTIGQRLFRMLGEFWEP